MNGFNNCTLIMEVYNRSGSCRAPTYCVFNTVTRVYHFGRVAFLMCYLINCLSVLWQYKSGKRYAYKWNFTGVIARPAIVYGSKEMCSWFLWHPECVYLRVYVCVRAFYVLRLASCVLLPVGLSQFSVLRERHNFIYLLHAWLLPLSATRSEVGNTRSGSSVGAVADEPDGHKWTRGRYRPDEPTGPFRPWVTGRKRFSCRSSDGSHKLKPMFYQNGIGD